MTQTRRPAAMPATGPEAETEGEADEVRAGRAMQRILQMQRLAEALSVALQPDDVARAVLEHGLDALDAAAGVVTRLDVERDAVQVVHARGFDETAVEPFREFPLSARLPISDALREGRPVYLTSEAEFAARYPALAARFPAPRHRAWAAVPLVIDGAAIGALALSFAGPRTFADDERAFIESLAQQCALALERARLYAAEREARAAAERLQALAAALSEAATPERVTGAVMEHGLRALGADCGVLALLVPGGEELEIAGSIGYPQAACMGVGRRWPASAPIPIAEATRTTAPVFVESREQWAERYRCYAPTGQSAAWAAVPVLWNGHAAGALLWTYHAPRRFLAQDRGLMLTIGRLASQALDRARLFEAERQARAEAEAANRAKAEFLSAMSHELRTPLNAIGGYAELLAMGIHGPVSAPQATALERIQRSQQLLLGLINDVLSFARVEAGHLDFRVDTVALEPLLDDVAAVLEPQIRARALTLQREPVAGLRVLGDADRVVQILTNLVANAVKFTEPGGRITLSAERRGAAVHVHVADTGRGIPAAQLESIFDPFVQLERHRTAQSQQGIGLGLAISRELARGMGGDVTARSVERRGSTFTLALPAAG